LKIQEITAPGDWEWEAASQQWVPVLVRAFVCYGETRIRRMSFRVGEAVRVIREHPKHKGLHLCRLIVAQILSTDAQGKQLLYCFHSQTWLSIESDFLQPAYDDDRGGSYRPLERWKLEDVVSAEMHPQDNPNFVQNPTQHPEPTVKESLTVAVEPEPVIKESLTTEPEPANDLKTEPWTPKLGEKVIDDECGNVGTVIDIDPNNAEFPYKVDYGHSIITEPMSNLRQCTLAARVWVSRPETPNSLPDIGELERCEANKKITIGYTVPNAYDSDAEPITEPIQRKRVLYIAGPMRGVAWFNYPMFDRVAKELREAGNEVISPADEDRKVGFDPFANPEYRIADACTFPSEASFESFDKTVRRCLDAVLRCDEIVLLPGWEESQGALAELSIAAWMGKRVRQVDIDEQDRMTIKAVFMVNKCIAFSLSEAFWPNAVVFQETQKFIKHFDEEHKDDEDILAEASRITRGSRQSQYGPPDQDFRRTAGMWSALFLSKLKDGVTFEPRDVALAMILLKTSRETHQRKRDNWVDIAGYASCGSRCN
jgi:hypothetical protein